MKGEPGHICPTCGESQWFCEHSTGTGADWNGIICFIITVVLMIIFLL